MAHLSRVALATLFAAGLALPALADTVAPATGTAPAAAASPAKPEAAPAKTAAAKPHTAKPATEAKPTVKVN